MYKRIFIAILGSTLFLFSDGLSSSLNSMLDEEPSDILSLEQTIKPKTPKLKKHSKKATVATVNGHKIRKREADKHLSTRTGGKLKDYDGLPLEQRKKLIEEMAIPMLAKKKAKKSLSLMDKKAIYGRIWIQKKSRSIKISKKELEAFYTLLKAQAKQENKLEQLADFSVLKERLRTQLVEKKIIDELMENVKIKVY